MSEQPQKKPRVEKLELNPETVANLTEGEAEGAKGGLQRKGDLEGAPTPPCLSFEVTC